VVVWAVWGKNWGEIIFFWEKWENWCLFGLVVVIGVCRDELQFVSTGGGDFWNFDFWDMENLKMIEEDEFFKNIRDESSEIFKKRVVSYGFTRDKEGEWEIKAEMNKYELSDNERYITDFSRKINELENIQDDLFYTLEFLKKEKNSFENFSLASKYLNYFLEIFQIKLRGLVDRIHKLVNCAYKLELNDRNDSKNNLVSKKLSNQDLKNNLKKLINLEENFLKDSNRNSIIHKEKYSNSFILGASFSAILEKKLSQKLKDDSDAPLVIEKIDDVFNKHINKIEQLLQDIDLILLGILEIIKNELSSKKYKKN
jgi:Rad3-related DNA helicase